TRPRQGRQRLDPRRLEHGDEQDAPILAVAVAVPQRPRGGVRPVGRAARLRGHVAHLLLKARVDPPYPLERIPGVAGEGADLLPRLRIEIVLLGDALAEPGGDLVPGA